MGGISAFPITLTMAVAWGEMDAFGHVNNIQYFKYFESARIKYFETIGLLVHMKESGIGPILAHTSCSYKKALRYPNTITIGARIKTIKNSSFIMEYCVYNQNDEVVALGEGVIVIFDYNKNEKVKVPETISEAIKILEKI